MQPLTISLEAIQALPAVPLEFRGSLPETSGLYFAIAPTYSQPVLYIGKAQNFRERLGNHHRLRDLQVITSIGIAVNLAWLEFIASDEMLYQQENSLIRQFRPPLNDLLNKDPNILRLEKQIQILKQGVREAEDKAREAEEKLKAFEENKKQQEVAGLLPPAQRIFTPIGETEIAHFAAIVALFRDGASDDKVAKYIRDNCAMGYPKARERAEALRELLSS